MFDRILFPTDGSEAARVARAVAIDAAEAHDATLEVLHVADANELSATRVEGEIHDAQVEDGEEMVDEVAETARARGVATETVVVQGDPTETIAEYAADRGTDLIVLATHGTDGLGERLLGGVTEHVIRDASAPVLSVPPDADDGAYPPADVLVATDGSEGAASARDLGAALAAGADATVHLVRVVENEILDQDVTTDSAGEDEDTARRHLGDAAARVREHGVENVETAVRRGDVEAAVSEYAGERGVDLVAVGTHGDAGLRRRLLGSTSSNVISECSTPVLSVRADETA